MRSRSKSFLLVAFAALAATGLLAVPAAFPAATPDSGDGQKASASGLSYRFENDAYAVPAPQAEPVAATGLSRLSIRLYGAYNYVSAADINKGARGLFDLFALYDALGLGSAVGEYEPVHGGYDFGADVIYQISPRLGVGLGVGYMRNRSDDSLMAVILSSSGAALTGTSTLSALPVRLGVFATFPVAAKLDLTANAGGTWYAGLKLDAREKIYYGGGDWSEMALSGSRSGLANLGFQGGLGLEYKVSRSMGFFVEAEGRYARLKNFDTVTSTTTSSLGGSESETGRLYVVTVTFPEGSYSTFTVETTPPVDTATETFREPKIDLSGFGLRAGIRIRF